MHVAGCDLVFASERATRSLDVERVRKRYNKVCCEWGKEVKEARRRECRRDKGDRGSEGLGREATVAAKVMWK
jgi:hypothetical protein